MKIHYILMCRAYFSAATNTQQHNNDVWFMSTKSLCDCQHICCRCCCVTFCNVFIWLFTLCCCCCNCFTIVFASRDFVSYKTKKCQQQQLRLKISAQLHYKNRVVCELIVKIKRNYPLACTHLCNSWNCQCASI